MPVEKEEQFGEFDVIDKYFLRKHLSASAHLSPALPTAHHEASSASLFNSSEDSVILGIGDDCALLSPPPQDYALAITTDMLVEGRHFFKDANPLQLGHKALAVNLSDLAAMGAKPMAFTLSIALPKIDHAWLQPFSDGLHALSETFNCPLIGGDTTAGPLNISITAIGHVPKVGALRRSSAQVGDDIWVSGEVGDARYILGILRGEWSASNDWENFIHRMHAPQPRVALGQALVGIAHAAIDVSDGLLGDFQHILEASHCHAQIEIDRLPNSSLLSELPLEMRRTCGLRGGDDYELCFTAPAHNALAIKAIGQSLRLRLTKIGQITAPHSNHPNIPKIQLLLEDGQILSNELTGKYLKSFNHFEQSE